MKTSFSEKNREITPLLSKHPDAIFQELFLHPLCTKYRRHFSFQTENRQQTDPHLRKNKFRFREILLEKIRPHMNHLFDFRTQYLNGLFLK